MSNGGNRNGLKEKPRTGRPAFLSNLKRQQLAKYIEDNATKPDGDRLTGYDIHDYIKLTFGKEYNSDYIYILLKKMGFSWITSRAKHPRQSDEIQEDFKKIQNRNDP
ncbi:helix-turn-helix domain-containing protein [Photobacterium kasasachensis]|uniref:helix-turn-helix domain-containing protein n=1 Tax=Photobacterium kasasachensis TaxID=2910240 RepID=UPI003D127E1E